MPEVNGAIVALDPHTGRVLAMVGGFSFGASEFNRATQANRQPGSAFKPFVYAAALDSGFTPASLVLDAPFVMEQGNDKGLWKPENYARRFYGLSTLRLGMEKSRNLMTVRMAQEIGMNKISAYARRFDITPNMPRVLAMALGAGETTLMRLTSAYAMLVNGGNKIEPVFVDRIQDRYGTTLYRQDTRPCIGCNAEVWADQIPPICRIRAKKCCRRKPPIRLFPCSKGSSSAVRAGKFTRWVSRWRVKPARPMIIVMLGLLAFRPIWLSGYMSAMTTTAHWVRMKQAGALPLLSSGLS